MSLPKILDFSNYNRYPGDDNPTTDADMQDYLSNQNELAKALTDRLWQPETQYKVGDIVASPSMPPGLVAVCVIAGATSDVEPAWTGNETTVVDNYCTWEMRLAYSYALATNDDVQNAHDGQSAEATHLLNIGNVSKIFELVKSKFTALFGTDNILPKEYGGTGVSAASADALLKALIGSGSIGSSNQPIYYKDGKLYAGGYTFRLNHNTTDDKIPVFSNGVLDYILKSELANATTGGGIVAALLEQNGYIKFANGLILQWGFVQKAVTTYNFYWIYPIPFPHAAWMVQFTPQYESECRPHTINSFDKTSCSLRSDGTRPELNYCHLLAIGY